VEAVPRHYRGIGPPPRRTRSPQEGADPRALVHSAGTAMHPETVRKGRANLCSAAAFSWLAKLSVAMVVPRSDAKIHSSDLRSR
jgi:hypothetical protein